MTEQPERQFVHLKNAGADSVSFHVEACADPIRALRSAVDMGLFAGIALSPDTPVEKAAFVAKEADFALCMSIHPGFSGQTFLPESYERIRQLRNLLPETVIEVDGGIHQGNIVEVKQAGAELLVAGSAIFWEEDPGAAYRRLSDSIREIHEARIR